MVAFTGTCESRLLNFHRHKYTAGKMTFIVCDYLSRNRAVYTVAFEALGFTWDQTVIRSRRAVDAKRSVDVHNDDYVFRTKGFMVLFSWHAASRRKEKDRSVAIGLLRAFIFKAFPSPWNVDDLIKGLLAMTSNSCTCDVVDGCCRHVRDFENKSLTRDLEPTEPQEKILRIWMSLQSCPANDCPALRDARVEFIDEVTTIIDEVG